MSYNSCFIIQPVYISLGYLSGFVEIRVRIFAKFLHMCTSRQLETEEVSIEMSLLLRCLLISK